jgi:hypothetical protein
MELVIRHRTTKNVCYLHQIDIRRLVAPNRPISVSIDEAATIIEASLGKPMTLFVDKSKLPLYEEALAQ